MDSLSYSIRSSRIVTAGAVRAGVVHVRDEKIERVELAESSSDESSGRPDPPPDRRGAAGHPDPDRRGAAGHPELNVGDLVVMPGLVDTHVHVNEPGRTDWEGFATAGRAAAAGGITTIVVMPLNCTPAATNVAALLGEAEGAAGKCLVDYGFWGGLVPGNVGELKGMWEAGALGFKCFMVDSGVDDFTGVSHQDLNNSAPTLARMGATLLVHAEDPGVILTSLAASGLADDRRSYAKYLASRPEKAERWAVTTLYKLALAHSRNGLRTHVVHVACEAAASIVGSDSADALRLGLSGETCPHYLTFAAEDIPDGATQFKCAPPIRDRATREALWSALGDGTLVMVVSDHSPCPPEMKLLVEGDFARAWGGISSLQLGLAATWTGARARGFHLPDIARLMCENPAALGGFNLRKGRIAAGFDADLVIFDPDEEWTVRGETLQHRHKLTPYDGMTLCGVVKRTILRGRTVYDSSLAHPFPLEPIGQWIKRDNH